MRALAISLAVLAAWHAAHADPAAPPLSPIQGHREDAQRLREQLRALDRERPPVVVSPAPAGRAAAPSPSRAVGVILLCIAGASAVTTVALYAAAPDDRDDAFGTAQTIGLTTTAIAGVVGLSVVLASRPVQVAPSVGPKTAGLAISGRL